MTWIRRAPSLPPGIGAYTVLDILKTHAPQFYAQVCDVVSANCVAATEAQHRRAENFKANITNGKKGH